MAFITLMQLSNKSHCAHHLITCLSACFCLLQENFFGSKQENYSPFYRAYLNQLPLGISPNPRLKHLVDMIPRPIHSKQLISWGGILV